jgi:hypothetical protein
MTRAVMRQTGLYTTAERRQLLFCRGQEPGRGHVPGQQMTCMPMMVAAWRNVSRAAQAELVALGIGQDEPVPGSLADVHLPRAKAEQPV